MVGAGDRHFAALQRLAQRIEYPRIELRELIEEEDAVVRQRDLARLGAQSAADQRRHTGRMMRSPERPLAGERAVGDFAGDRGNHRYFQEFGRRQRGQDRWQTRGEH